MKIISKLLKDQKGMTGLETAIILIAFVTVAAVFGYAVLSAGLFSAEQGKSTIYAGLQEASSNLKVSGSVIAKSADNQNVNKIIFTVVSTPSGNPIDLTACDGTSNATNKCVISLTTAGSEMVHEILGLCQRQHAQTRQPVRDHDRYHRPGRQQYPLRQHNN